MPTISLATLKQSVYDRLEGNSSFYGASEVVGSINDAIRTLNLFTGFLTGSVMVDSVAQDYDYTVPSGLFLVTRVRYDGRELDPQGFHSLCESSPEWMADVASSDGPVATWTPLGLHRAKKVILHPAPERTGARIEMFGVVEHVNLVFDSDTINCSTEFSDLIVALAAHERMVKNGGMVARDAMLVYKAFLERMKSLKRYKAKVNPRFWLQFAQPEEAK